MEKDRKVNNEEKKPRRLTSHIANVVIILFVVFLLANCFNMFRKIGDKKKKLNELQVQYEQALIQKSEYEYLLSEDNQLEYIERIAREKYGYVSPGERAFYDSSLGK